MGLEPLYLANLVKSVFPVNRDIAWAVARAENYNLVPDLINDSPDTCDYSTGPFQINTYKGYCPTLGYNVDINPGFRGWNLTNPVTNAWAARYLSSDGSWFCPWSVFEESCGEGHRGTYREYLNEARHYLSLAPDLNFGSWPYADLRRYDTEDWPEPKGPISGIAVHHSAITQDNDWLHIKAIQDTHILENGWPGIGYSFLIGKNGAIYYVTDLFQASYHVCDRNHELLGICLMGDFTNNPPPRDQIIGAAVCMAVFRKFYGYKMPFKGHGELVLPTSPQAECATACPGATWPQWRSTLDSALTYIENSGSHVPSYPPSPKWPPIGESISGSSLVPLLAIGGITLLGLAAIATPRKKKVVFNWGKLKL